MTHKTIFISDLHLSNTTIDTTKLLITFLENIPDETDALYILGDLFQFWIGDDNYTMLNEEVKNALKKSSFKTPIYLMAGNRDFLLGDRFARESGCTLLSDPHTIDLYGRKTVLTHGDLLCSKDKKYKIFRNIVRFPFGTKLFLKLPLTIRLWIAKNIQKHSARVKKNKNKESLVAQPKDIKNLINETGAEQIIYGHIHIADIAKFVTKDKTARSISLGEWDSQGNALIYNSDHQVTFKNFSL